MIEHIVPYCERLVAGSVAGAEPLNTVSNVAFIFALLFATLRVSSNVNVNRLPPSALDFALMALPLAIGLGSAAFHYAPSQLTHALDVAPFSIFALLVSLRLFKQAKWSQQRKSVAYTIWIVASLAATTQSHILAHSLFYVPTLLLLLVVALTTERSDKKLYYLTAVFALALAFRSADLMACSVVDVGTHSLWHLFTALACALCIDLAIPKQTAFSTKQC